ncbi:DExH-box ATP-dependent RNA helicase DExH2 [Drosophila willistoni]|nr:DExH-box ATP-dependent RNA helicase DExH2 [Drosophila willistoni]
MGRMARMRRGEKRGTNKANISSSSPPMLPSEMASDSKAETKPKNSKKSGSGAVKATQELLTGIERHRLELLVNEFVRGQLDDQEMPGLSTAQRAHVHRFAQRYGLKTRTHTKDGQRVLCIIRKETSKLQICQAKSQLTISVGMMEYLAEFLPRLERRGVKQCQLRAWPQNGLNGYGLVSPALIPPPNNCFSSAMRQERFELPISAHKSKILELLKYSQVLIVNGATGSGKSTQVPQFILENATDKRQPVRVVVSQPRRVAAITVAGRIAQERSEQLGQTVGYQIRMESKCSANTALALTTSGCLLRALAMDGKKFFAHTSHLIIDEVHERDLDTDFLLLAAKIELQQNRFLKLILMSATMNLSDLSAYFGNAPVLDVEGRSFGVRIWHLEQILQITGYMTPMMRRELEANKDEDAEEKKGDFHIPFEERKFDSDQLVAAYNKTRLVPEIDIDFDLIVSLLDLLLRIGQQGAVIVFLPGYHDMIVLLDRLERELPRRSIKTHLLHSQMDTAQQKSVFQVYKNVQLKVILSTNIGQTSITIPDLLYVIDLGKAKIKAYDPFTDTSHLTCTWISQADAKQRAGRVGRKQHGICYRLYSSERLEMMSEYVIPEMQRRTLDEICLLTKVAAPKMPVAEFLSNALNPPQGETVVQSCNRLKLLNILRDEDEQITDLGKIISMLPLDVHLGKCLVYSIYYRCLGTMTIIAAYYSVRDPFVLTADNSQKGKQQAFRQHLGADMLSDSLGIVKLYEEYLDIYSKKRYDAQHYCEQNFVCRQSMDMFISAVTTLRESVKRIFHLSYTSECNVGAYDSDFDMVRLALTAGLYPKLAFVDRSKKGALVSETHPLLHFSRNSCLHVRFNRKNLRSLPNDWIVYVEKSRSWDGGVTTIEQTTSISSLMLALVAGKVIKLEEEPNENLNTDANSSSEQIASYANSYIYIDDWIRITVDHEFGQHLLRLRSQLNLELAEMLKSREMSQSMHLNGPELVHYLLQLHSDMAPAKNSIKDNDLST